MQRECEYDADLLPYHVLDRGVNGDTFFNGKWWICIGHRLWVEMAPTPGFKVAR